jgi:aspartate/methionine/tyrosine aminotransferase
VHYTPALGHTELRQAIARWYQERYGIAVPVARIAVTTGSSAALLITMGVILSPGKRILMADPGYPCNRNFVRAMDGEPVGIAVGAQTNYQLTAEMVERNWTADTAGVLVCSPSNPTGSVIDAKVFRDIDRVVRARGGWLISDEIYHGITYGTESPTALAFGDDVFVINSFSKYFGMTGFRLGWLVAPEQCMEAVDKLAGNLYISAPDIAQQSALAAFAPESVRLLEARRGEYQARRDFLVPRLRELGFEIPVLPDGAFYVYADASRFTSDSFAFCFEVLEQTGVAIAPGKDFGAHRADVHVRFSYPKSLAELERGVARLAAHLAQRKP